MCIRKLSGIYALWIGRRLCIAKNPLADFNFDYSIALSVCCITVHSILSNLFSSFSFSWCSLNR